MGEPESPAHRRRSSSVAQVASRYASHSRTNSAFMDGPAGSDGDGDGRSDEEWDDDEETGLTHAERKKRRRRKRRSTRLDERVVPQGEDVKAAEETMATTTMIRHISINAVLIGLWYSFSISISVYNKWMFSKSKEKGLDFHFPLFTTSLHMVVQFALACVVLFFFPQFRPRRADGGGEYAPLPGSEPDNTPPAERRPLMTRWFYVSRIGPCGLATALDIGLGNFSLRFISLTFYTMCKSSVLGFVLVFAFLFRLETPTWKLCGVIVVMTAGVIMMVAGEAAFDPAGFVLVMSASACSGFRWSLTQILLLRNPATSNPFSSILFLTPVMFLALFVLALPVEGPARVVEGLRALAAAQGAVRGAVIMLFPGCLAFLMVAAEFALLQRSSVVTLSVCGIFKEVLTISTAGLVFGDKLSPINVSGLVVTIVSIAGYNYLKYVKMSAQAHQDAYEIFEEPESMSLRDSSEHVRNDDAGPDDGPGEEQGRTSAFTRDRLRLATNDI